MIVNITDYLLVLQKIGNWYRRNYKRPEAKLALTSPNNNPLLDTFYEHMGKPPRKRSLVVHYMKKHYGPIMKAESEQRFEAEKAVWDSLTEEEREQRELKEPEPVAVRTKVATEFLGDETDEFREELKKQLEKEHEEEVAEWKALQKKPKTPAELQHQLRNACTYALPVAEKMAEQLQAAVSILIIGPIPDEGGQVGVRR